MSAADYTDLGRPTPHEYGELGVWVVNRDGDKVLIPVSQKTAGMVEWSDAAADPSLMAQGQAAWPPLPPDVESPPDPAP